MEPPISQACKLLATELISIRALLQIWRQLCRVLICTMDNSTGTRLHNMDTSARRDYTTDSTSLIGNCVSHRRLASIRNVMAVRIERYRGAQVADRPQVSSRTVPLCQCLWIGVAKVFMLNHAWCRIMRGSHITKQAWLISRYRQELIQTNSHDTDVNLLKRPRQKCGAFSHEHQNSLISRTKRGYL
jgi:hypothetical protein